MPKYSSYTRILYSWLMVVMSLNVSMSLILFCRYLTHLNMVALLLVMYIGYKYMWYSSLYYYY